jgi:hypothetical protein
MKKSACAAPVLCDARAKWTAPWRMVVLLEIETAAADPVWDLKRKFRYAMPSVDCVWGNCLSIRIWVEGAQITYLYENKLHPLCDGGLPVHGKMDLEEIDPTGHRRIS